MKTVNDVLKEVETLNITFSSSNTFEVISNEYNKIATINVSCSGTNHTFSVYVNPLVLSITNSMIPSCTPNIKIVSGCGKFTSFDKYNEVYLASLIYKVLLSNDSLETISLSQRYVDKYGAMDSLTDFITCNSRLTLSKIDKLLLEFKMQIKQHLMDKHRVILNRIEYLGF